MLELHNVRMKPLNVKKKNKETTKCEKITVIWVVGIAQREDGTVKYEKNITWYNRLSTSRYYITFF